MRNNFNIQSFISKFNDLIPYEVNIIIGGKLSNSFRIDETKICGENYKGKMYPSYNKSNNPITLEYKSAQELSLPIQINVKSNPFYSVEFDNEINPDELITNGGISDYTIRLKNTNDEQVGCIFVGLNRSGDVVNNTCFYESTTGRHKVMHSIHSTFLPSRGLCITEQISYTERYLEFGTETTVNIYKTDGIITCTTIKNGKTKTKEEVMMQPITPGAHNSNDPDGTLYLTRSVFDNKDLITSSEKRISYESYILNNDLMEEYGIGFGCVGDYVGHTFIKKDNSMSLCIHTIKDGYNLYLPIDITGTDPFRDTSPFYDFEDYYPGRDEKYLDKIRYADRTPLFITKKEEDGSETLVGYKGIMFEEYSLYRGANIRSVLAELTKNGYSLSEEQHRVFDLIIKLRDMKFTSPDGQTVMDNFEEVALAEFKPFEEQYITPFVGIKDINPKQLIKR